MCSFIALTLISLSSIVLIAFSTSASISFLCFYPSCFDRSATRTLCIISHKQKCRKYRRTPHRVSQGHLVRLVVRCLRCRCTCITRRNRSSCSYITPIKKCSATHLRNTLITHNIPEEYNYSTLLLYLFLPEWTFSFLGR